MEAVAHDKTKQLGSAQNSQMIVRAKDLQSAIDTDPSLFRFYPIAQHFEGLAIIRGAPSKKQEGVLFSSKGLKLVLTTFCQHCHRAQ